MSGTSMRWSQTTRMCCTKEREPHNNKEEPHNKKEATHNELEPHKEKDPHNKKKPHQGEGATQQRRAA